MFFRAKGRKAKKRTEENVIKKPSKIDRQRKR